MAPPVETPTVLSDIDVEQMESWLFEFDRMWTNGALEKRIANLPTGSAAMRQQTLLEAVKVDMERRWRNARPRNVENYLDRFPELRKLETTVAQLIETEIDIRRQCQAPVDRDEFARRFPTQSDLVNALCNPPAANSSAVVKPAVRETVRPAASSDSVAENSASPADDMPEQFGRYRVLRKLGEGAMGAVYLAEDSQLHRKVALKTPTFSGRGAGEMIERFYSEARSSATLRHPNICPVFDVGEIDGRHFISMAYIKGRMLSQYINSGKQLPERTAAALVRKLARALQHAHSEGIIHRDLKPGNVIIDGENEPIVMDFGLARRLDGSDKSRITQDGVILGTPAYMSPEQVSGELDGSGPRSDIYSLGVMLYELLTGDLPFGGPVAAVLGQIMVQEPQPPSAQREGLDPRLEAICLKMMAKKQDERFASMKDVSAALAGFLKGESPLAKLVAPTNTSPADGEQRITQPAISATMVGNEEMQALAKMFSAQTTDAQPIAAAVKRPRRSQTISKKAWIVMAAAAAACVLVAGIVLSIGTDTGTIKINLPASVAAADLRIVIDGNAYRLPRGGAITLETGQHKVEVFHKDKRLASDTLVVISGRINSITIPSPPHIPPPQRKPPSLPPSDDRSVAQWLFKTGSWFTFRTAGGREGKRLNIEKWRKRRHPYASPLPEEPFVLTGIQLYASSDVTDADMPKLRNLNSLETLFFVTSVITSRGLEQIKNLPQLKTLGLYKTQVFGDGYRIIAEMKQLRTLTIHNEIENDELSHLSNMTWLTSLTIRSSFISDAGLEHLTKLTNLETLSLTVGPITGAGLANLKGMNKLRTLTLAETGIVDSGLVHLQDMTSLQSLNLSSTRVTDAGMESLAGLTGLTHLSLNNTVVGDEGLKHLSGLLQLADLDLTGTRLTGEGLAHLKSARKMRLLYLAGTGIDDEGLVYLRDMPLLSRLYLQNTNVTGSGLHHLTDHRNLAWLFLGGANFTVNAAVLESLGQLKSRLSRLYFYGVALTAAERAELQQALGKRCTIIGTTVALEKENDPDAEPLPGELDEE